MNNLLSQIGALLLSVAILIMGNGLQSTLLPVRASFEDFDAIAIGLMGSALPSRLRAGLSLWRADGPARGAAGSDRDSAAAAGPPLPHIAGRHGWRAAGRGCNIDRSDFVKASSGLLLANGIGAVLGPIVAAYVMRKVGTEGLFLTTAGFHLALVAFVAWRMMRRAAPAESQRSEFDLASTAPTMVALEAESSPTP